jgi:hypothetical protein
LSHHGSCGAGHAGMLRIKFQISKFKIQRRGLDSGVVIFSGLLRMGG